MKKTTKKVVKTASGETPDEINIAPEINDKGLKEQAESTAVLSFGRFNPVTIGHEKLFNKVHEIAKKNNGKAHIVASHSENTSKNPLPQNKKLEYIKKVAHPDISVSGSSSEHPSFLHAAKKLHQAGHKHLVMVAGSDRVDEYKSKLDKYNGHPDHYSFKSIKVVSAGQRDPDSEGAAGMSGSKLRAHAHSGNKAKFKSGLPKALHTHADEIMNHIKSIHESTFTTFAEGVLGYTQRRKRAINLKRREPRIQRQRMIALKRFATDIALKRRAQHAARSLIRRKLAGTRGADYANLSTGDKIAIDKVIQNKQKLINAIAKRMVGRVRRKEAVRLARYRAGLRGKSSINNSYEPEFLDYELFESIYNIVADNRKQEEVLEAKAEKSGISLKVIKEVYARGLSEYNDSIKNKTPEQYAYDRVNSYLNKGKAYVIDSDLNEDAASHMRAAKAAQLAGKYKKAALHRRIAGALMKGDTATAKFAAQQLKTVQEEAGQHKFFNKSN